MPQRDDELDQAGPCIALVLHDLHVELARAVGGVGEIALVLPGEGVEHLDVALAAHRLLGDLVDLADRGLQAPAGRRACVARRARR